MVRCLLSTVEPNYKKKTHYPYIVTSGHLNNYYGRHMDGFNKFPTTKDDSPEYLCLRAIILSKSSSDIYWTYLSKKIERRSGCHLEWTCELLCDIQVKGGSYAKLGDRDLHWDEGIKRWTLPDITKENPLFRCMDYGLYLETDGDYIWCLGGVFAEPNIRMNYYLIADTKPGYL